MPQTLPPRTIRTFPALIRWLANQYHDGAVLPMSSKIGVSPALMNLWVKGQVGEPKLASIEALCVAYDLDFNYVRGLLRGRAIPPVIGSSGCAATPPVAAEPLIAAEPAPAPLPVVSPRNTRDIMSRLRAITHYRWGASRSWAPMELAA